jgi:hypothetical protein
MANCMRVAEAMAATQKNSRAARIYPLFVLTSKRGKLTANRSGELAK